MVWDRQKLGPRIRDPAEDLENLRDPAKGEKVPRCRVCGLPATPETKLIRGAWTVGTFTMIVILCEREISALDPRLTDPLTA